MTDHQIRRTAISLLFCAILIFTGLKHGFAQGIYQQTQQGPVVGLYKLNPAQVDFLIRHPEKADTAILYSNKVKELSRDSFVARAGRISPYAYQSSYARPYAEQLRQLHYIWQTWENGYFLVPYVSGLNSVQYMLLENPSYRVSMWTVDKEHFAFVTDTAGRPLSDLRVTLDTMICYYDASAGGYKIRNKILTGVLHVAGKTDFVKLNLISGVRQPRRSSVRARDRYHYNKPFAQGYFVTNKPRYKFGDTVFYKAFIADRKAKPFKKNLLLLAGTSQRISRKLLPQEPGVYHGYFVVNDTFPEGQNYINIYDQKSRLALSSSFVVEEYETETVTFRAMKLRDPMAGTGATIYAEALTSAGLPVMDGKIKLQFYLQSLEYADADSVCFPFSWLSNRWEYSVIPSPTGITEIFIPDSLFIRGKGAWVAKLTFMTADNREFSAAANLYYSSSRDRMEASITKDTLSIINYHLGKLNRRALRVVTYSKFDKLGVLDIQTPYVSRISPETRTIQIYSGDTLLNTLYYQPAWPEASGRRTHDSVFVNLKSPSGLPVHYRLYRNNELVKSGTAVSLDYQARDKSKHSYHIQYGIPSLNPDQSPFFSKSFHLSEKAVNVSISTPETVYPGQTVPVDIRVTDAKGRPVNRINLTAWAVSTEVPGITRPVLPYLGLMKGQKGIRQHSHPLQPLVSPQPGTLAGWMVPAFRLRENKLFALHYPASWVVLTDTSPKDRTEVEVFTTRKGKEGNPRYVLMNDTLVYSADAFNMQQTWLARPGRYRMTVRTYDRIFTLNDVDVKPGVKNFIGINEDSMLLGRQHDTARAGHFTGGEMQQLRSHLLHFRYQYYAYDTLLIKINGKLTYATPAMSSTQRNVTLREKKYNPGTGGFNNYYQSESYYLYGPLNAGDVVELSWKNGYTHEFRFEPGMTYSMTKSELIRLPLVTTENDYFYFFSSTEHYRNTTGHWFDPDVPRPPQPPPPVYQPHTPNYSLPEYQYRSYAPPYQGRNEGRISLFIKNTQMPVSRFWLFNMDDSSRSNLESHTTHYSRAITGTPLFLSGHHPYYFSKVKPKNRYLMVLYSNDSTWLLKHLLLDSHHALYLSVSPKDFRKLRESEFMWMDRMVKTLGKAPLAIFTDTPTVSDKPVLYVYPGIKGRTRLEITVAGPGMNYVVDQAFVVLERDGYFVRGAITNEDGLFVMEDLPAGRYMLKIKGQNYHYWITYNLQIETGKLHIGRLQMKPYAHFRYNDIRQAFDATSAGDDMAYEERNSPTMYENRGSSDIESVAVTKARRNVMSMAQGISVRGARNDGNGTFIDGMRVVGNGGAPPSNYGMPMNKEQMEPDDDLDGVTDSVQMNRMLDELSGVDAAKKTRRLFRDYAYWIPSLNTNRFGRAGFTVTYPDNITGWKTFVPAMDGKRHTGLGEITVNAYKPVSLNLGMPNFLTENDRFLLNGRLLNYTGRTLEGEYILESGIYRKKLNLSAGPVFRDSLWISAEKPGDTVNMFGSFSMANGYRDAELRRLPVNAATITTGVSRFFELTSDTQITWSPGSGDLAMNISVYNHRLAMANEMLRQLDQVYGCGNQYLADKLFTLLTIQYASQRLQLPFNREKDLNETLRKLRRAQDNDGSFRLYKNSRYASQDLTIYAAEVLYKAHMLGHENNAWHNAARYLVKQLKAVDAESRIDMLRVLKVMGRTQEYDTLMKDIRFRNLSANGKLNYLLLQKSLNKTVSVQYVIENLTGTADGSIRFNNPGGQWWDIYHDDARLTVKAWQLLSGLKEHSGTRERILDWMMQNAPLNSHTRALTAEAMVIEYDMMGISDSLIPRLEINGKPLNHSLLPAHYRIVPGQSLTLKHSGAPVYVAANRTFRTYSPASDPASFRISCNWPDSVLKEGQDVTLKIRVMAARTHQGVVIEVPIPAGFGYAEKISNESTVESEREYRQDRVLIYSENMPFGEYTFTVRLQARFSGTFHAAPARAALEFYPDKSGYTAPVKITISGH